MTALVSCPGCGLATKLHRNGTVAYYFDCMCGWLGPSRRTVEDAAAAWNRRAPALRWRSEPPNAPGWWWCEYRRGTPAISHYTQEQCSQRRAWPSTPNTRWAGPIPEPDEGEE